MIPVSLYHYHQWGYVGLFQFSTCLARLRASSRCRPRSRDLWTSLSHRAWTLSSRFLMRTTSCFKLEKRSWEPAFSRARTCSLCVFTSFTNTWTDTMLFVSFVLYSKIKSTRCIQNTKQSLQTKIKHNTLCSSIWKSTVSSKRLGGWAIFRVCSACVNQLIVSWREDWKPVAKATASSNFACKVYVIQVT